MDPEQEQPTEPEPTVDHPGQTVVFIGELAVWVTLGEYYARYNH